jgi:hypothetical protein
MSQDDQLYKPGDMSKAYWKLSIEKRREVDGETDKRFIERTGVNRKLNWNNPDDRPLARQWLRIRDEVMDEQVNGGQQGSFANAPGKQAAGPGETNSAAKELDVDVTVVKDHRGKTQHKDHEVKDVQAQAEAVRSFRVREYYWEYLKHPFAQPLEHNAGLYEYLKRPLELKERAATNKYVYAFAMGLSKREPKWVGEYHIDDKGDIYELSVEKLKEKEKEIDARPMPSQKVSEISLVLYDKNNEYFHFFWSSRHRLSLKSLTRIMKYGVDLPSEPREKVQYYGYVDLFEDTWFNEEDGIRYITLRNPQSEVDSLHDAYVKALDEEYSWNYTVSDITKKLLLTQLARSLLRADAADELDLRDDLREDAQSEMEKWIADFEAKLKDRIKVKNHIAQRIVDEMESPLIDLEVKTYPDLLDADTDLFTKGFAEFCEWFANAISRLPESDPGNRFFVSVLKEGNLQSRYFWIRGNFEDLLSEVLRPKLLALTRISDLLILKEFTPRIMKADLSGLDAVKRLSKSIFEEGVTIETKTVQLALPDRPGWGYQKLMINGIDIEVKVIDEHVFDQEVTVTKSFTLKAALELFQDTLHVIAFYYSTRELISSLDKNAPKYSTLSSLSSVLGDLAELTPIFGRVIGKQLAGASLAWIGAVGAILNGLEATFRGLQSLERNDYDAAAGFGVAVLGGLGVALGWFIIGAGLATGPVGVILVIVGAIVSAIGWLWALFASDSDLETYVLHSLWGKRYGEGGILPWTGGRMDTWDDQGGYDKQIVALYNLLAGFKVEAKGLPSGPSSIRVSGKTAEDRMRVKITFGMTNQKSKLHIWFNQDYPKEITALMTGHVIINVNSEKASLDPCTNLTPPLEIEKEYDNESGLIKSLEFKPEFYTYNENRVLKCEFKLDLDGKSSCNSMDSQFIPQTKWLPFELIGYKDPTRSRRPLDFSADEAKSSDYY